LCVYYTSAVGAAAQSARTLATAAVAADAAADAVNVNNVSNAGENWFRRQDEIIQREAWGKKLALLCRSASARMLESNRRMAATVPSDSGCNRGERPRKTGNEESTHSRWYTGTHHVLLVLHNCCWDVSSCTLGFGRLHHGTTGDPTRVREERVILQSWTQQSVDFRIYASRIWILLEAVSFSLPSSHVLPSVIGSKYTTVTRGFSNRREFIFSI
jgi:hypothetical protein